MKSLWFHVYPFDQAVHDELFEIAELCVLDGFQVRKSTNFSGIKDGKFPELKLKDNIEEVPSLFNLSRTAIRCRLRENWGNLNQNLASRLEFPKALKVAIFSPFSTH